MRILVTGSRHWSDVDAIYSALVYAWNEAGCPRVVTLVHGACPYGGADIIATEIAETLGWTVEVHPADWKGLGRKAGPLRNQEMVNLGADVCLAFFMPDSRGTVDCARRAEQAGIPVLPFHSPPVAPRGDGGSV